MQAYKTNMGQGAVNSWEGVIKSGIFSSQLRL